MKLHLGCGQVYLKGYVNIDFPSSSHTVQDIQVADEFHDLRKLAYPPGSIDEIRLHHVFEHFSRPTALALLSCWNVWLKQDGILRIEVPDFSRSALVVLNPLTSKDRRFTALRHIFGSQEAEWAYHLEGWSSRSLTEVTELFGFTRDKLVRRSWKGTYNIELFARKTDEVIGNSELSLRARRWLSHYLVDHGESEERLLDIWMKEYFSITNQSLEI